MKLSLLIVTAILIGCSPKPAEQTDARHPAIAPAPPGAIPQDLQGRWALTPADCDPARGDVRGLLTIGEDALAFGVSPQTVDRVIVRPGRVAFDTSDGVASRRVQFRVSPDGRQLTRIDGRPPEPVFTRCANQPS